MTTETAYRALQNELVAAEKAYGLYLADESIDYENVEMDENAPGYWTAMIDMAVYSASFRAEDAGLNINVLIGRVIY